MTSSSQEIHTSLPRLFNIKQALPRLEKALREGNITSSITRGWRQHASTSVTASLVDDWEDWESSELGSNDPKAAGYGDELDYVHLDDEELGSDPYFATVDVQEALLGFRNRLRTYWPLDCNTPHSALLKLVDRRENRENSTDDGIWSETFEFDTLTLTHGQRWGRIKFIIKNQRNPGRVKFSDELEHADPDTPQLDLCALIESSAQLRKCLRVDLSSGAKLQPRNDLGFNSAKTAVPLKDILTPMKIAGSVNQITRSLSMSPLEKASVAMVVACSLLQLSKGAWGTDVSHEGQWLNRNWKENGICFLPDPSGNINPNQPFLPINIGQSPVEEYDHAKSAIFSLAITLLQLQDDEVIQRLDDIWENITREEHGEATPETDNCALYDLFQDDKFHRLVSDQFRKAIVACVHGRLVDGILDKIDETIIQRRFFNLVIRPLQEYYRLMDKSVAISERQSNAEVMCLFADSQGQNMIKPVDGLMARYTDQWFQKLQQRVHELVKLNPKPEPKHAVPIKIAILDTGIQLPPDACQIYEGQITCRSWLSCNIGDKKDLDKGDRDLDGHGTHCASLILKVAPNAHLYVARVFESRGQRDMDGSNTIEAIYKALTWAIDKWEVDIVTMSFGCDRRIEKIDDVMRRAQNKNVLMLAAASNSGALQEVAWPARSDRVICIHALDGYGNPTKFTPTAQRHAHNFGAPGHAVKGYWPEHLGGPEKHMSGTSCAAPIAAGVVAVLLEYVNICKSRIKVSEEDLNILERLRERQGMIKVLGRMIASEKRSPYEFLLPWELLDANQTREDDRSRLNRILCALDN